MSGDDVVAALATLEEVANERETALERIHARAALALVEQALAEARAILERASTADYQDPNEWLADALAWLGK